MKRIFQVLMMLLFLLAGCSPVEETIEVRSETATPLLPTETASMTESQPTQIESATQTESTPVSVFPFAEGSIGPGEQEAYSFESSSGEEIIYWLSLPEEYDSSQTWPLILSIHGFLGFEPSLERVFEQSPPHYVDPDVEFPFIVIAPQAPSGSWAQYHEPMDELIEFLSESISIDPEKQFLTGLSGGAIAAWQWALAFPDRFTGMASIAGSPSLDNSVPENICSLKDLPIWVANSEADQHAPIEQARAVVMALEECGSAVTHFTTYTDLSHLDSIRMAYGGPELYDWMLALMDPTLNPTSTTTSGLSLRLELADSDWDGEKIPDGQQCQSQGGENPSTPEIQVGDIPEGSDAMILEFSDRSFRPMDEGGHGQIGFMIPEGTRETVIPSVPGHTFDLPKVFFPYPRTHCSWL